MIEILKEIYIFQINCFKVMSAFFIYIQDILKNLNLATTLLILALIFRKDIKQLIKRVIAFKYRDNELHFLPSYENSFAHLYEEINKEKELFKKSSSQSRKDRSSIDGDGPKGAGGVPGPLGGLGAGGSGAYSLFNNPNELQNLIVEKGSTDAINTLYQEFARMLSEFDINNNMKDNLYYQTKNQIESFHSFVNNYDVRVNSSLVYSYQKIIRSFLSYSSILSNIK